MILVQIVLWSQKINTICSANFVGRKVSDIEMHLGYPVQTSACDEVQFGRIARLTLSIQAVQKLYDIILQINHVIN